MRLSRTAAALAAAAALVLAGTGIAGAASAADHTPAPTPTPSVAPPVKQILCVNVRTHKPRVPPPCRSGEFPVPFWVDAPGQTLTWTTSPRGPVLHVAKPAPVPTPSFTPAPGPSYTHTPQPTGHEPWPTR